MEEKKYDRIGFIPLLIMANPEVRGHSPTLLAKDMLFK